MVNMKSVDDKKMVNFSRNNSASKKPKESLRIIVTVFLGIAIGFFIGMSFPILSSYRLNFNTSVEERIGEKVSTQVQKQNVSTEVQKQNVSTEVQKQNDPSRIWVSSNPQGAETLPPGIVVAKSDFNIRRVYGNPSEDLKIQPKYLVTFTVGYNQKKNIDAAVKKFSENFTIVLFHYDGRTTEWNEFEWAKRAIHFSVLKQTKWWYAKRFLHPDIVAPYDYIFVWDEDLGVEHFNAEEYIKLVRKHGLDISQPGLDPHSRGMTWEMTKRQGGGEVHKKTVEKPGWCSDPHLPPCAAFVEIMAPVFSREAWRCVWYLIQNDLVHGWGLDFALQKCVEPAHEKIGVVDAQWVVHQGLPSLGSQGQSQGGKAPWQGVRDRCKKEWAMFQARVSDAEKAYNKSMGIEPHTIKSQKTAWWADQGNL